MPLRKLAIADGQRAVAVVRERRAQWGDTSVPTDALTMFIALANDDDMAVRTGLPLYFKWREAHHPVELHIFSNSGHGFGMRKQGFPSDRWTDLFGEWLGNQGLLQALDANSD